MIQINNDGSKSSFSNRFNILLLLFILNLLVMETNIIFGKRIFEKI